MNLHKNKTKVLLSNALMELLEYKNFEQIKLNEICEKAMVHKTTFYNHFEDKYDLLNYVMKNLEKNILCEVKNNTSIIDYCLDISTCFIKSIKSNSKFYQKILNNQNGICKNIIYNSFILNFKEIIKDDKISIPTNYISIFYVNAIFSIIIEWVSTGMKENEDDFINYIKKIVTYDLY